MSNLNVLALREESADTNTQLEQRRSQARNLELQVLRKEAELRRMREEQALLKELHSVNELTLRKRQQQDNTESDNRLRISQESLEEVIALENEIKNENKRTEELQESANTTSRQMEEVEKGIEDISNRMALVKQATGWDKPGINSHNGSLVSNEWMMRKKNLTALHEEQQTVKALTTLLDERIETLTRELEAQGKKGNELTEAHETLRQKNIHYENLLEQLKSMERLTKKKERLLDSSHNRENDDYKTLKLLEGDKKVLYGTLSKFRQTNVANTRSIISLEVRLRELETKLESVNLFLQQVFADVEEEAPMENVPENALEVPLKQFEELCHELEHARETLIQRDDQLSAHDAKVEQLERKTTILRNAIASRATSAQLEVKSKEKEFEALMSHVDYMKAEFDEEYKKLSRENATLRSKLTQIQ
ncbi:hypothetical protein LSM04_002630 [Trypanosoma melophagium]|uniref:uncharacterized protein n=1 Tax=Trypanosoma melophagium TaxID=715481 RepID=UPI00351A8C6F|nr:hypothetical protein LSM04_002630 [Trypanosoma melophagium]